MENFSSPYVIYIVNKCMVKLEPVSACFLISGMNYHVNDIPVPTETFQFEYFQITQMQRF